MAAWRETECSSKAYSESLFLWWEKWTSRNYDKEYFYHTWHFLSAVCLEQDRFCSPGPESDQDHNPQVPPSPGRVSLAARPIETSQITPVMSCHVCALYYPLLGHWSVWNDAISESNTVDAERRAVSIAECRNSPERMRAAAEASIASSLKCRQRFALKCQNCSSELRHFLEQVDRGLCWDSIKK